MPDPTNELIPMPRKGLIPDPDASESEQILGTAAHPESLLENIDPKWRPYYEDLIQRRDALIDNVKSLSEQGQEVKPDPLQDEPAEIGTTASMGDQMRGMATHYQETLEEVDDAISRIQNGTYGTCLATGRPIPEERLKAIPWTRFTLEAEQEMESKGAALKANAGPRPETEASDMTRTFP